MNCKEKPLYLQVKDEILHRMLQTDIHEGERLPTEAVLVETLGVSRATVKRALGQMVAEGLVEQRVGSGTYVLPYMVELRRQQLVKPKRIALVVPEIADRYSYRILRAVCRQTEEYNDDLELYNTFNNAEKESRILRRLEAGQIDGIILWPAASYGVNAVLREFTDKGVPLVLIDHNLPELNGYCVTSDHVSAGYQATRYLLEKGHRRIGFIDTAEIMAPSQLERVQGYRRALEEWGVPTPRNLPEIYFPKGENEEFKTAVRAYFENQPEVTAAVCGGGVMMRVVRVLNQMGRSVPQDISLVCFDGFENSRYLACPPTYVRQSEEEIGRRVVQVLHQMFVNPQLQRQEERFPVVLHKGKTVRDLNEK